MPCPSDDRREFIGAVKSARPHLYWRIKEMKFTKIIAAVAAAAVAASAASFCVSAEENEPAGYVYFTAEKTTIGQGFTVEPTKVPFYEGDTGLDIVERAAEVLTETTDYGAYITAFADEDIDTTVPDEIQAVCPEMTGRTQEGYLSNYDYTAESGWSYFINDDYAQVGIGDYVPTDGDVLRFAFTVYGYGADLGVDNSSWGGAAALVPATNKAELIRLCAELRDADADDEAFQYTYTAAMEALAIYNAPQEDIDNAVAALTDEIAVLAPAATEETADVTVEDDTAEAEVSADTGKGSPSTGVEGVAVAFAAVLLAGAGVALSKKQ